MKCHGCGVNYCDLELPDDVDPAICVCLECWLDDFRADMIRTPDEFDLGGEG